MLLAASNIGWSAERDAQVYQRLSSLGFDGLEIAPTRVFPHSPYDMLTQAEAFAGELKQKYGLGVLSMQSIWFGRAERLFASEDEREALLNYTKRAFDFAARMRCPNLVFGSPKNRRLDGYSDMPALAFFSRLAMYAEARGARLSLEANPAIYGCDYITQTDQALRICESAELPGLAVNLDVGTMIANRERPELLRGRTRLIGHVHISEPGLLPIERRTLHAELAALLRQEGYERAVSLETGPDTGHTQLDEALCYIAEVFA